MRQNRSPSLLNGLVAAAAVTLLGCAWHESRHGNELRTEIRTVDAASTSAANSAHAAVFDGVTSDERFPSAAACRTCHPDHYREWSVSPHAYAQLSPVFNAMSGTMIERSGGTLGDFCIRCHTPIGMALGEPHFAPNSERASISLEGVTCVVCHRVDRAFGKNNGRSPIREGSLFEPVFGPTGGEELARVRSNPDEFGPVVSEPGAIGRRIHSEARFFAPISEPGFCGSCHDVTFVNGFRLEEAFSEYKASPAADRGETCQDCHMGRRPGVASGYRHEPAARIGGVATKPRKRTNHMFVGPDYSVVHPGIFPHHPDAAALATATEWTEFDWEAGWGTDAFEDTVGERTDFPERWAWPDDRYDARDIIEGQLALLDESSAERVELLRRGYELSEIRTLHANERGIDFEIEVRNRTDGHNVPTGFIAERLVFLRVTISDRSGAVVFRSGDLDPNGDLRDRHSLYVHDGNAELDEQLFSLQSHFLTRSLRGGEREEVLAINDSEDPLPFTRPATRSNILTGRPAGARIHKQGIEPGGHRIARYQVDRADLSGPGTYDIRVELIAGMVPVNLIDAIHRVGFEYGMSARDVAAAVVDGHLVLWERRSSVEMQ